MHLLVIDDLGQIWPGDSRRLREAFDSPFSGGEFIEYAVKNLGFVAVNHYGASCQARLRPSFVTGQALASLESWWKRNGVERMVLTTFDRDWTDELVRSGGLDARLAKIARAPVGDFLSRPLSASAIEAGSVLADVIASWPHIVDIYETGTLVRLLRSAFDGRYVVVGKSSSGDKLVFKEFGEPLFRGLGDWRSEAVGAPIETQPWKAFGRWVADTYGDMLPLDRPRLDEVDVIVGGSSSDRTRLRYQRFIFPLSTLSGEPTLVTCSIADDSIDLRGDGDKSIGASVDAVSAKKFTV